MKSEGSGRQRRSEGIEPLPEDGRCCGNGEHRSEARFESVSGEHVKVRVKRKKKPGEHDKA